ncbi:unnamed protein product [Urochloa humidicola]
MDLQEELRRRAAVQEAALRAVQKPLAKPPRGRGSSSSAAAPPPPPKVYRVELRELRDLVQRLTGALPAEVRGGALAPARPQHHPATATALQHSVLVFWVPVGSSG